MDATGAVTVVDPRKVDGKLVEEAIQAALDDARKNAPEATLTELFEKIGPHVIYENWMPRMFKKKGSYGKQVAPLYRQIKEQMLAAEPVDQADCIQREHLSPKVSAALKRGAEFFNGFLTALETEIAADYKAQAVELLRYADVKLQAEVAKRELRIKDAANESSHHLVAAIALENELDAANIKNENLAQLLTAAEEMCRVMENSMHLLRETLSEQLAEATARINHAEAERDAARNDGARLAELLSTTKEQAAAASARAELLKDRLDLEAARVGRVYDQSCRRRYHSHPARASYTTRRKG